MRNDRAETSPPGAASPKKFKQLFICFCAADAAAHLPDLPSRAELPCVETVSVRVRVRVLRRGNTNSGVQALAVSVITGGGGV